MIKKSISNIAWPQEDEDWVLAELQRRKWHAVEVAPSRIWTDFTTVSFTDRKQYVNKIHEYGLEVCSLHSLFFRVDGVDIFGNADMQAAFQTYMCKLVELATDLQVRVLILGSPGVRNRKELSMDRAIDIASNVLRKPAEYAEKCGGGQILIEPLSRQETNFINNHVEALELIKAVNSKGFGLHLDAKSVDDEENSINDIIKACAGKIEHFHVNEPGLKQIGERARYHHQMATALKAIDYSKYISIEMRQTDVWRESIIRSLDYVDACY